MNKNLIILLGEILTAVAIYFGLNAYMPMDFNYTCPFDGKEYQTTFAILISAVYIVSVVYATILHMFFDAAEQNKLKAYQKKLITNDVIMTNERLYQHILIYHI